MKVRNKLVYNLKPVWRIHEFIRPSFCRFQITFGCYSRFESAGSACSADKNSTFRINRFINDVYGWFSDFVVFRIHFMFRKIFDFNFSESAKPDMQGYVCKFDAFFLNRSQKFLRKVKSGSRRCNRSDIFRIYRLVHLFIRVFCLTFNVIR